MTGPLILIALGTLLLLHNLYPSVFRFGRMWPIILIVIGLSRIAEYFHQDAKRKRDSAQPQEKKEGE